MLKPTVMIVDDDAGLLSVVGRRCEAIGLCPLAFCNLHDALAAAEQIVPDLILLDVHMPSGDGLEACERLARDERLKSVPVIMLTGEASVDLKQRTQHAGARYVRKGAHLWDRLRPVVEQVLGVYE